MPFIIVKDTLYEFNSCESHDSNWLEFKSEDGPEQLRTVVSLHDGHSRISIGGVNATANVVDSLISSTDKKSQGRELVRKIHA